MPQLGSAEEATIVLSKVVGFSLIIIGAAIILRRRYFLAVFATFPEQRLVRTVVSMIELIGGLYLATRNVWFAPPAAIITLIGWLAVAEGAAFLLLPDTVVTRVIRAFNTTFWYMIGGTAAIAVGLYLAGSAFGWW